MPWHNGIPPAMNRSSGHMYSGKNVWLLWRKCKENNYSQNKWATFHQWSKMGAKIKKDVNGTLIKIFIPGDKPGQLELKDDDFEREGQEANNSFVRYYTIFNQDQVKDWYEDTDQGTLWPDPTLYPYESIDKMVEKDCRLVVVLRNMGNIVQA